MREVNISWLVQELTIIKTNSKNNVDYLELKCYNIFEEYANDNFIYGTLNK